MATAKSIEEKRHSFLMAVASGRGIEKIIPTRNDDVKQFLDKLDEYEESDRNIRFVVK